MDLKRTIFKKNARYNSKLVNACIMRIRYGHRKDLTIRGYKMFIFKMMRAVVEKNICNYTNLLNGTPCRDIPDHDEIIAECWIIFDKCLEKFVINKKNNFYFYFNKAMSRNFFRRYQRELQKPQVELSEGMQTVLPDLWDDKETGTCDVMMQSVGFTELDKRIALSRMRGQKTSEFLEENPDVSANQYSNSLNHMKTLLRECQEQKLL